MGQLHYGMQQATELFMLEHSILLFTYNGSDYRDFKSVNTCNVMNSKIECYK